MELQRIQLQRIQLQRMELLVQSSALLAKMPLASTRVQVEPNCSARQQKR